MLVNNGLYNMVNGHNDIQYIIISAFIGKKLNDYIPRYRDCSIYSEPDENGNDFEIYTRMGGGNYNCWNEDEIDYSSPETIKQHEETCDCAYHQLLKIEKSEWYNGAEDDDFDCTYRTLYGKFTPEFKEKLEKVKATNSLIPIEDELKKVFPEMFERKKDE